MPKKEWETELRLAASIDPSFQATFFQATNELKDFTGAVAATIALTKEKLDDVLQSSVTKSINAAKEARQKYLQDIVGVQIAGGSSHGTQLQQQITDFTKINAAIAQYQTEVDKITGGKGYFTDFSLTGQVTRAKKEVKELTDALKTLRAYERNEKTIADTNDTIARSKELLDTATKIRDGYAKQSPEWAKANEEVLKYQYGIESLQKKIYSINLDQEEYRQTIEKSGRSTADISETIKTASDQLAIQKTLLSDLTKMQAEEAVEIAKLADEYKKATEEFIKMNDAQANAVAGTYQQWGKTYQTEEKENASWISEKAKQVLEQKIQKAVEEATPEINAEIDAKYAAEIEAQSESLWNRAYIDRSKGYSSVAGTNNSVFGTINSRLTALGINLNGATIARASASLMKNFITEAAGLEAIMSEVEAYSGATVENMEELTAKAKELGATTVFSAQESAKAMTYMAKAGWSTEEIMAGMSGVISLAAASGEDLASVSSIVADSLTAFGLDASQTQHFSDVLAKTATKSNTDVGLLGETFQTVAPVAGALGYSVEDVATMVGLMANSGIKGSRAGTSLRNIFNGLLEGVQLTSAANGTVDYSAIDVTGKAKSLQTVLEELRQEFEAMTDAEKTSNAFAVAGMRGYSGLLAILNATTDEYEALRAEIEAADGAAQDMATTRLDNFTGQVTLLKSAWEGLSDVIGEQFLPVLTEATKVLTSLVSWATTGAGGAIGGMLGGAGIGAGVGMLVGHPVIGGLVGLTAAGILETISAGIAYSEEQETEYTKSLRREVERLQKVYADIEDKNSSEALQIADELEAAQTKLENSRQTAKDLKEELQAAAEAWNSIRENREGTAQKTADSYQQALNIADSVFSSSGNARTAYVALLAKNMPSLGLTVDADGTLSMSQAEVQTAIDTYYAEVKAEQDLAYLQELQAQYAAQRQAYENASNEYYATIGGLSHNFTSISDAQRWVAYAGGGSLLFRDIGQDAKKYIEATEKYREVYKSVLDFYHEYTQVLEDVGNSQAADKVVDQTEKIAAAYETMYAAARESMEGQFKLWEEADEIYGSSMDELQYALETQKNYYENYASAVAGALAKETQVTGLGEIIDALIEDGSAESINALMGIANATTAELQEYVAAYNSVYGDEGVASTAMSARASAGVVHDETINVVINAGDGTETGVSAWIEANAAKFADYIAEAIANLEDRTQEAAFAS